MPPATLTIPDERAAWRPQSPRPARRAPEIRDPIVEPSWSGLHVLAHIDAEADAARLIDEAGDDATDDLSAIARVLLAAVGATDAVIDGFVTRQSTQPDEGTAVLLEGRVSALTPLLPRAAEIDVRGPRGDAHGPIGFVAIDLLHLDGQPLLDVPLLERKRLLESVIRQGDVVRVTPHVRPPIEPWLASWKAAGFEGVVVKAANSRYQPSSLTDEWTLITQLHRR